MIIREHSFKIKLIPDTEERKILLFANQLEFLEETWKVLAAYTKKIDPQAPIGPYNVSEASSLHAKGLKYEVCLDNVLPRLIVTLYGKNVITEQGNCHGAATMASGIVPIMLSFNDPNYFNFFPLFREKTEEICNSELSPGDIVTLRDHSLIFLNSSICISKNGRGEGKLKLYRLGKVLEKYSKYTPETLLTKGNEERTIQCFRKNPDWIYPDEIIQNVKAAYDLLREYGANIVLDDEEAEKKMVQVEKVLSVYKQKTEGTKAEIAIRKMIYEKLIPSSIARAADNVDISP